jgi:hypothetical protein
MSTEENKKLVLRWREEIWNKRNVNIIDELAGPDYGGQGRRVGHYDGRSLRSGRWVSTASAPRAATRPCPRVRGFCRSRGGSHVESVPTG